MTIRIFYRVFFSFMIFIMLSLLAFWLFYYRGAISNTKEKIINSITADTQDIKKDINQFLMLRNSELNTISEIPSLKVFLNQRDLFKTKTRKNIEDLLVNFAQGNKAIERIRIVESNYFERDPSALEVEESQSEFNKQGFVETLKIKRDEMVDDRFEADYNFHSVKSDMFVSRMLKVDQVFYSITSDENNKYLSIGKVIESDITREISGILIVDLSIPYIMSYIERPSRTYVSNFILENDSNETLFRYKEPADKPIRVSVINQISEVNFEMLNNSDAIVYKSPIGSFGINFIAEIDTKAAWKQWHKTRMLLLLFFLGFTLISIFISYLLSQSISIPIRKFNERVYKFDEANPEKISNNVNVTEIKELTTTFNRFVDRFIAYKHELQSNANLVAIGKSSAMIAHDVRSPLSVIGGYLKKKFNDEKNDKYYQAANRSTEKLNKMTENLLAFPAAKEVNRIKVNIADVIKSVLSETSMYKEDNGIALNYKGPEELYVRLDRDKINRVLTNLVINSIQACAERSGMVDVVSKVVGGSSLEIEVIDNGCGIPAESVDKIFDIFFTRSKTKGCGLGLSYCKQVVEAHGGNIRVESEVGKGTMFSVVIPDCVDAQEKDAHPALQKRKQNTKKDGIVLVVDDETDILDQWEYILRKKGHSVTKVKSGSELLKMNIDYTNVKGAVVDYQFHGSNVSGLEIIEFLKTKKVSNIHLCTGFYGDEDICRRAKELDVSSIVPKPIPDNASELFD